MNPTRNSVHIDRALTEISIATMNAPGAFVAQSVFPRVPVKFYSDKYFIYNTDYLFRSKTEKLAPTQPVALRDYKVSTSSYAAEKYAVGCLVPDEIADNSDLPLRPMEDASVITAHDMQMFIESNWAAETLVTGAFDSETTLTGTNQWSDFTNSNPIGDIDTAVYAISDLTGLPVSMMGLCIGAHVWKYLKRHPQLLAAFGGGFSGLKVLTPAQVATVLGVGEIKIAEAVTNTNNEGNATQTLSRIIGKHALVYYAPKSPSLMTPSAGYFFAKQVSEVGRWYSKARRSEVIENYSTFDFKITAKAAGYLIINAVA